MTSATKPQSGISLLSFLDAPFRDPAQARAAIKRMPRTAYEQRQEHTSTTVLEEIRAANEAGAAKTLRLRTARLAREAVDKAAAAAEKTTLAVRGKRKS